MSEAFSQSLAGYKPLSPRHAAILKSWRDHSDKGEQSVLWQSLERAAANHGLPAPRATDFIDVVLGCTMQAARLNDHSEYVLDRFEKLKQEIVGIVKDAERPLGLWRDLQRFEEALRCVSAWNKDPVFGVIGIQSGPRDKGP
ncbi:hypothetical protein JQ608_35785, partial [Bradyrhizobium liaoningense]|uniref:hypothetical protein n=1 Tax=Bradyrhizobium liaoningense TaxID=43992 RepID=UPI001BA5AB06